MNVVAPTEPGDDGCRHNINQTALPVYFIGNPGACNQYDQNDYEPCAQWNWCRMGTALIGLVKELIFPGNSEEVCDAKIRENCEKDESKKVGHGNDCKRD